MNDEVVWKSIKPKIVKLKDGEIKRLDENLIVEKIGDKIVLYEIIEDDKTDNKTKVEFKCKICGMKDTDSFKMVNHIYKEHNVEFLHVFQYLEW